MLSKPYNPRKLKIAPGKWWLEDYFPFWGPAYFQGASCLLDFQGVTWSKILKVEATVDGRNPKQPPGMYKTL